MEISYIYIIKRNDAYHNKRILSPSKDYPAGTSSGKTKTEVMVTFLTEEITTDAQPKRKLGGLEGKVTIPDDFNEPLNDLKDYM
ncbi:MAG: hypothetical protein JWR54_2309 [Mucilaginibacter sp.]|nr:hypothetical protein [Mucilaginibacter sp.]